MEANGKHRGILSARIEEARALYRRDAGEFWHGCLFWSFWIHLAFFALGYGFREVMPCLCAIFLLLYYRHKWQESVLRRLPILPLFFFLWIMIAEGVVFSIHPWESFLHACMGLNKGYILPFIGMECVRSLRDLRRLVLACVVALFWEGLDGIWQDFTGRDFIMGYKKHCGRLTASLDDYWVGNYVALVLVPASGIWFIWRRRLSRLACLALCALVFFPPLYLFFGASARAGLVALVGTAFLWSLLTRGMSLRTFVLPVMIFLAFMFLQTRRMDPGFILKDGRWSLWELAWEVIKEYPLLGCGIYQYNPAFRALGLAPARDDITIAHPHNIYLDLLVQHGVVGTAIGMVFLAGIAVWFVRTLRPQFKTIYSSRDVLDSEAREALPETPGASALYWQLAGLFAMSYAAWLLNGIFGHDFYRIWWFGLAMAQLGVGIGAVEQGLRAQRREGSGPRAGNILRNLP